MTLTADQVRKVARLSRLSLNDHQVEDYARELSRIVDVFAHLEAVETADVAPMAHPLDLSARLREDRVAETDQREAFQAVAPATADGVYLVPKVIE